MTDREVKIFNFITGYGIATAEEIDLVKDIAGGSYEEVLNSILYCITGYRNIEQYCESEGIEE
jgi:hypothetical protein